METISDQAKRRRWTWIGNVLGIDNSSLPRVAPTYAWVPEGKRKRRRLRETWRSTVGKERMVILGRARAGGV